MVKVSSGAADLIRAGGAVLSQAFKSPQNRNGVAQLGDEVAGALEKGVGFEDMPRLGNVVRRRKPRRQP